ncbi:MAG: hypothetical protein N3G20_07245, partial [Verrucomicrobiae bacterium]|nr:hypothetical protein [Verrucomicrobiae bacterium]
MESSRSGQVNTPFQHDQSKVFDCHTFRPTTSSQDKRYSCCDAVKFKHAGQADPKMRICAIISFGFPARMLLHTGVVPELRIHNIDMSVICPGAGEPQMREVASRLRIDIHAAPNAVSYT